MSAVIEAKARDAEQATWDGSSGRAAFDAAVEAAELYMQAMQLANNRTDRARLSAKCKELLSAEPCSVCTVVCQLHSLHI